MRYGPGLASPDVRSVEVIAAPCLWPLSIPLEEVRADIGLALDRVVIAIDAVGNERKACDHGVLVELDRVEPDDRGVLAVVPFERRGARRLFASRDGFREYIAFDEGLH